MCWIMVSHVERVLLMLGKRSEPVSLVALLQFRVVRFCSDQRKVMASGVGLVFHTKLA